jgi:hypothetical protein
MGLSHERQVRHDHHRDQDQRSDTSALLSVAASHGSMVNHVNDILASMSLPLVNLESHLHMLQTRAASHHHALASKEIQLPLSSELLLTSAQLKMDAVEAYQSNHDRRCLSFAAMLVAPSKVLVLLWLGHPTQANTSANVTLSWNVLLYICPGKVKIVKDSLERA